MATLNRGILQEMALCRLADAKALFKEGRHSAAYYLAGYVVECGLKAVFAAQIHEFDFPEKGKTEKVFQHDLNALLRLAGLEERLRNDAKSDEPFAANWAIVKDWVESSRYDPLWQADPASMKTKAEKMVRAIDDPDHGVLQWLQEHW